MLNEELYSAYSDLGEIVLQHMDMDATEDVLAHYGRLGMKWYQHIYGEYQGAAKYAEKGEKKLAKMKAKNEKLALKTAKQRVRASRMDALKRKRDYRAARRGESPLMFNMNADRFALQASYAKTDLAKMEARDAKRALKTKKLEDKVNKFKAEAEELRNKEKYLTPSSDEPFTREAEKTVKEWADKYKISGYQTGLTFRQREIKDKLDIANLKKGAREAGRSLDRDDKELIKLMEHDAEQNRKMADSILGVYNKKSTKSTKTIREMEDYIKRQSEYIDEQNRIDSGSSKTAKTK